MTTEEREHLLKIKSCACVVCGKPPPSEAHHCRTKADRKRNHFRTIPLCYEHHRGLEGIHNGKGRFEEKFGSQKELLHQINKNLADPFM